MRRFCISLIYNAEMADELGINMDDYDFQNFRELEELGYKVKELRDANEKYAEYQSELVKGQAASQEEVETLVDEFIAKLKANGVDTIVAEVQKQIDAWNAAK